MNINNAFPSKYLKSGDLDGDVTLTISDFAMEVLGLEGDHEEKPVLYFEETEKGFVLNRTNSDVISRLHGPETDGWLGKQITLFATQVDFRGKQTLAIRVRLNAGVRQPQRTQQAAAPTNGGNGGNGGNGKVTEADLAKLWLAAKTAGLTGAQFREQLAGIGIADPRAMSQEQLLAAQAHFTPNADLPF